MIRTPMRCELYITICLKQVTFLWAKMDENGIRMTRVEDQVRTLNTVE